MLSISAVLAAPAAAAERPSDLSIPRSELRSALLSLGAQARISISLEESGLAGNVVGPLRGRYTVRQALDRLLAGTGARVRRIGTASWRVGGPAPAARRTATKEAALPRPAVDEAPLEVAEIVVTGTKRRVELRNYAGSVELLTGEQLSMLEQARGSEALVSQLPSLGSTHFGSGRNKLFIRGIADSSFNGPTQATVGQYLGETRLNYNAPDPDLRLYDMASVEVLKGPQGTLYGAGSLGGILRLEPEMPDLGRTLGIASASLGKTAHGDFSKDLGAIFNLPLAEDRLGLRAVAYGSSIGGYIDDRLRGLDDVNRTQVRGGRITARWVPSSEWTIDASVAGQAIDAEDSQYADREGEKLTRASSIAQGYANGYGLASLTVRKEWAGLAFVSATGLVRQRLDETYDATPPDQPPTLFRQVNEISLLSMENRLARDFGTGARWVVGTSFLRNRSKIGRGFETRARAPIEMTGVENGIDEATLFGEATLPLPGSLALTLGSRITHSRLTGGATDSPPELFDRNEAVRASRSETVFLPSAALSYSPAPGTTMFLRYQEGFRPGGLAIRGALVERYRSDDVATLEAGFRRGASGDPVQIAASAAYTRWRHIQADSIDGAGLPATNNIGDGVICSIDMRAAFRMTRGLFVELGAVLNQSKVVDAAPSIIIVPRSSLPNVAGVNGRIAVDYVGQLRGSRPVHATAFARYVGRSRLGIGALLGELQGDYLDTGAEVRVGLGRASVSLGITNLLDSVGNRFSLGSPFTLVHGRQITPLRPRSVTLGVDVSL